MRKLLFLLLLPLFAHAQVYTPAGGGTWMHTADNYHFGTAFSSNGFRKWYQSYQVDSAEINNGTSPQTANFNISGNGVIGGTFSLYNASNPSVYTTTFTNGTGTTAFQITNGGLSVLSSSLDAYDSVSVAHYRTTQTNLHGFLNTTGYSFVPVAGLLARGVYSRHSLIPSNNADTLIGVDLNDNLESNGSYIATTKNLVGGSGYTNGTYSAVPVYYTTGANLINATANITVSGGAVTSVTIVYGGCNYSVNDLLTVNNSFIGGTGSGFTFQVASVGGYTSLIPVGLRVWSGMNLKPTTYAKLPAILLEGTFYALTDANTNTWGATISSGGGSDHVVAYYDGSNLTVVAK